MELDIDAPTGSRSKVNLQIEHITKRMLEPLPGRLADLLEIACYVFCADQFTPRDTIQMQRLGEDWRRNFRFRIPVRDIETWRRRKVVQTLVETLSFLSDDFYTFEFVPGRSVGLDPYLKLGGEVPAGFMPQQVLLFSGGLDSLTGAALALFERGERVALVSHRSSRLIDPMQRALVSALQRKAGAGQVFHVAVDVNKGGQSAAEYTQRSRSFLFAALGFVVARLFNRTEVSFAENGLPISPHVVGARSTRTTHPRVLDSFGKLFTLLADKTIRATNPLCWLTKAEALKRLAGVGCADMIASSFSCSRVGLRSRRGRHCGRCSQCIDRRFAILAAGLADKDSADGYAVELFTGERVTGPEVTLATSYILAARKFASMSELAFSGSFGEVFRALPYVSFPPPHALTQIHQLHERHGKAVTNVVNERLSQNISVDTLSRPPQPNLLTIMQRPIVARVIKRDVVETEQPISEQAAAFTGTPIEHPICFAVDARRERVVFQGGVELTGALFRVFRMLAETFEEDQAADRRPQECRAVTTGAIAVWLKVEDGTVRKNISLAKRSLQKQFEGRLHVTISEDDIIENVPHRGYRLNPFLRRLRSWELDDDERVDAAS